MGVISLHPGLITPKANLFFEEARRVGTKPHVTFIQPLSNGTPGMNILVERREGQVLKPVFLFGVAGRFVPGQMSRAMGGIPERPGFGREDMLTAA